MKLGNNENTVTRSTYEIKNIHTSTRHPGIVYACLYFKGELEFSATLKMCCERILENLSKKGNSSNSHENYNA